VHIVYVLLYIVAVGAFVIGGIESLRTTPMTRKGAMPWLFVGLLAWVLVQALMYWGVGS
jgi:hypothetical protein